MTNPIMGGTVEETPLSHACARGFLDIAELLIQNQADVNYLCSVSSYQHCPYTIADIIASIPHSHLLGNSSTNRICHHLWADANSQALAKKQ